MPSVLLTSQIIAQPPGRPDPGRRGRAAKGKAAKSGQNKSINDADGVCSYECCPSRLSAPGGEQAQSIPFIPRSGAATRLPGYRVNQLAFSCLMHGHQANAGVNAARNILRAGLALQEAQDAV
jgi:putative transposase